MKQGAGGRVVVQRNGQLRERKYAYATVKNPDTLECDAAARKKC
jgi:hypothetical protein